MAYDELVAQRIRQTLKGSPGISQRKMFGGVAFLLNGNMCCGVVRQDLVLRLGNEGVAQALQQPHTRPMDFTGRPLGSMIYLSPEGYQSEADLQSWVEQALAFCETLPAK